MTRYLIVNGTIVFFILICAVTSYRSYKQMSDRRLLIFAIYYLISFATEITSDLYSYFSRKENHFIYNIFLFSVIGLYYLIFKSTIKKPLLNWIVTYINPVIFIYAVINLSFFQGFFNYNTYTHYAETYFIMLCCIFYFYDVLRSDNVIYPLKEYFFWIAAGLFISNMCSISYYLFFYDMIKVEIDPDGIIYEYVNFISKIIEYTLAIFAFLSAPRWKKNNLSY